MSRGRRAFAHAIVGFIVLSCSGSARAAELTVTAQAVAAHGEFLTQAPPPPTQGVLCLVDSGVDVNPDTETMLVGRESIHGGTTDDVTDYHHGTYVAMVAGAAANGWGMIGAWPGLRVLSVRVLPEGSEHLSAEDYRAGIVRCVQAKNMQGVDVRAVELALGGPATDRPESEITQITDAVAYARQNGLVVLSAAGNDAGAVNVPASIPGVIAVGATDRAGALCAFSSRGAEVDITAPGCDMEVAMVPNGESGVGQSSSLASAYAAGVVVGLRSYRPDLSVQQTEDLLRGALDVGAVFRAAGLAAMPDSYVPAPPPAATGQAPAPCNPQIRVCTAPRVRNVRKTRQAVIIRLYPLPKSVRVAVRVNGKPRRHTTRSRVITINSRKAKRVTIRFVAKGLAPSDPTVVRLKRRAG
ncbi:S8 family peptidase [Solirubrobacter soli]|uniref:S8 family peptidase n=1 Tax=Solirubrobacter soli TaxID=363832 RepID=UPI0004822236|nr:S8 family serine peptidase [Solirubrobacter soli]